MRGRIVRASTQTCGKLHLPSLGQWPKAIVRSRAPSLLSFFSLNCIRVAVKFLASSSNRVGSGNGSYDAFRAELAKGVGTTADRVALHTLHQHDAPGSDFITERMLAQEGLGKQFSNADFDAQAMKRVASAARQSLAKAEPITHFSHGAGRVEKVASNRRILGPDGIDQEKELL